MKNFETSGQEIAIVGMAGRFPGARNIDEFWRNVRDGVESISFFSDQELIASGVDPNVFNHPGYVKAYGAVEDIEWFDAAFFGFSPREAATIDPQQRLFLECAWEALENAGYDSETYTGRIGVYAGAGRSGYLLRLLSNPDLVNSIGENQIVMGNEKDFLSTRTSYKLNLNGPSMTVQTACSTSLVAVHLACQSLLIGESDMALAGGVSIHVLQKAGYLYQEGTFRSPDGHCRAFDARAGGFVSGSGVAIVVLKRLMDAIADGDCIHAVIKGSALNNDGSLKIGYTAPSTDAQAQVIAEALSIADIEPETITYIEAHGAGTPLGDPIEIAGLTQAFHARTHKKGYCAIGSVKTNIGHLDTAAGIAGLIKTVLALKHRLIPPSLNFEEPNPKIDFANSPFYVNRKLTEWKTDQFPRRAGVSSFGIGGTNAHLVLEEAPAIEATDRSKPWQLLLLSAKTSSALETATANLAEYLKEHPDLDFADVAYTYRNGRRAFRHRRIAVCRDVADAMAVLETRDPRRLLSAVQESQNRSVVFLFPGSGAQYINMGLELYQHEPVFREQVDRCAELLAPHLGLDLRTILYPIDTQAEAAAQRLRQTSFALPALFVTNYALAKLWMAWGVRPRAMIGHSLGEYVAACLAGVFSLPDALGLVALRGRLLEELPKGAMLSVPLSIQQLQPLLQPGLSLAAVNGPALCVVSGSKDAIAEMETALTRTGLEVRYVPIDTAAHSEMVMPILEPFTQSVAQVSLHAPHLPYISNVTGTWITAQEATSPSYWAAHLRQTVHFADGIHTLLQEPDQLLLEVGPGHMLSMLARQQIGNTHTHLVFPSLRSAREQKSEMVSLLTIVGQLWLAGVQIDWSGFSAYERRQRLPLPTYPFERQRYWVEQQPKAAGISQREVGRKPDRAPRFYMPSWKQSVPPGLPTQRGLAEQERCWLVFVDECGLASQLVNRLRYDGQHVITVTASSQLSKVSDGCYSLDPRRYDDYLALLTELEASNKLPDKVVHLWGITPDEQTPAGSEHFEMAQYRGFCSLLFLAQALGDQSRTQPLEIVVVSNNVLEVTGRETLCPEKATVLGPCKVLQQEYPIVCRAIDIELPRPGMRQKDKLIDSLLAELATDSSDPVIAYRGNHRWVQTIEEVPLDTEAKGTGRLREGRCYLVIDGPGDLGLVLAESLFCILRTKLVIVEPLAFPPRDTWEDWLATHNKPSKIGNRIRQMQMIEEAGAELLVVCADVTDSESMQIAINQAYEHFGVIDGIISVIGFVEDARFSTIRETRPVECVDYLQAKIAELLALEQVLQGKNPDFCLVCSSLAPVFGGKGRVLDVAMNLLVDTFICWQNQATTDSSWLNVNWDSWQLNTAKKQQAGPESVLSGSILTAMEMTEAFQCLVSTTATRFLVLAEDLQTRCAAWLEQESVPMVAQSRKAEADSPHSRPDLQTLYVAPGNEIEKIIADFWRELLGIERIGVYDNFFELGGHSLMAAQLIARLRKALLVEIPLQSIFERPTIAGLAEVAEDLFVEKIEQLPEEEAERFMSNIFHSGYQSRRD